MTGKPEEEPSLGQFIWLVRRELEWANAVDKDQPLRFEVGPVELDVAVEVSRTTGGGGGLDLKVAGAGVSGQLSRQKSRESATTVHVTLTPHDKRTPTGKFEVSALDTEPPPRRAAANGTELPPVGTSSSSTDRAGSIARNSEPPPAGS